MGRQNSSCTELCQDPTQSDWMAVTIWASRAIRASCRHKWMRCEKQINLSCSLAYSISTSIPRARLQAHTQRLRQSLENLGYLNHQGSQQNIALESGAKPDTMVLRDRVDERNLFSAIFCAPATSSKQAMMRLTLNSCLMGSEPDHVEATAREVAQIVRPWDWPIARRARRARASQVSN